MGEHERLHARIVAFDRSLRERVAQRVRQTPHGLAVFHDPAPMLWDLNHLMVGDATASFAELADEVNAAQRELPHRMLVLDVEATGHAADARRAAWVVERHVAMVPCREPDRPPPPHRIEELAPGRGMPARRSAMREEPWGDALTIEAVLDADRSLRAGRREREFASLDEDGAPAGLAKLFTDPEGRIGQVEDVVTVPARRNRGHARAVVSAALAMSRAAGHELTFLWADEDDWPRTLYERMGWGVVGRRWRLRRLLSRPLRRL